ncbi:Aste57867_1137 [Aphanomyces stellatus]|uniref:Aste57867_1137 protein n=1 Tax=Aphanomyces stellatus TaxID=120398 RepID=A0A485K5P7_9STRA|nr:hypothetical protein As57867_001136 [Aphanomyces stellatus]VFT78357.1 Aste57867_1137 [Aphanomyces stellatus]
MSSAKLTIPPPEDPSYNHQYVHLNGIRMHYIDVGPRNALPLVLVHGFPDLWWGWRFQIQALRESYRVIVPDNRGYGGTDAPSTPKSYRRKTIAQDYVALLNHLNIPKAVFIGHDWGGDFVWKMSLFHPDRVIAVASICTPFAPQPSRLFSLPEVVAFVPSFSYQLFLVEETSPAILDRHVDNFLNAIFGNPSTPAFDAFPNSRAYFEAVPTLTFRDARPRRLTAIDFEYYVRQFQTRGFQGPLNWYRTREVDHEDLNGLPRTISHPSLFICAEDDVALTPALSRSIKKHVPNLTRVDIPRAGHWVLFEAPERINPVLLQWLAPLAARHARILYDIQMPVQISCLKNERFINIIPTDPTDPTQTLVKRTQQASTTTMPQSPPPPPEDPSYNHQYAQLNGIRMHYIDVGPRDGVPLVLVHGFPDLWYGWRVRSLVHAHTISMQPSIKFKICARLTASSLPVCHLLPLAYPSLRVDNRGYGETDATSSVDSYRRKNIAQDYVALLDHLDIPRAVFIGHDWGGDFVWKMCLFHPDRVVAVASICTPYFPPPAAAPVPLTQRYPEFEYQLTFADPSTPAIFDRHVAMVFHVMFWNPPVERLASWAAYVRAIPALSFKHPLPRAMSASDFAYYVEQFRTQGFRGPLSWYRTGEMDWADLGGRDAAIIPHPALFVQADLDNVLRPEMSVGMEAWVPHLTRANVANGDHWLLWRQPDRVNAILNDWLASLHLRSAL